MVVKGEEEGIEAATEEEAAVVFATEAHGRKIEGKFIPSAASGKFPNDGIQQSARGDGMVARAAAFFSRSGNLRDELGGITLKNLIILLHDLKVIEFPGG